MARLVSVTVGLPRDIEWKERIHVETFHGGESMTPGVVGSSDASTGPAHLICAQRHCRALETFSLSKHSAAGRGLRRAGASCRSGVCHNCESGLVSGSVAEPLDAPAEGNLLVCCSQPIGDLVIDL